MWHSGHALGKEIGTLQDLGAPLHMEPDGSFSEWAFPTSFSSFDRHLIHELAESLKLSHSSYGSTEDNSRYVVIASHAESMKTDNLGDKIPIVDEGETPNWICLKQTQNTTKRNERTKQI